MVGDCMPSMPLLFRFATGKKQAANHKDISIYRQPLRGPETAQPEASGLYLQLEEH